MLSVPLNKLTKAELSVGSLLFVPRGYWHKTEASGISLSFSFTSQIPPKIDLIANALRNHLIKMVGWRRAIRPNDLIYQEIQNDLLSFVNDSLFEALDIELERRGFQWNRK
jgi:ribosomal protein L16 Arg81 hydroxylase